jgi:membrane associated rhomboid family serine protease
MFTLFYFGRTIYMQYGAKFIYLLYGLGALFGSLSMNFFMPNYQILMPQVGADPCVSAMFTFYGLINPQQRVLFFFFPMPILVYFFYIIGFVRNDSRILLDFRPKQEKLWRDDCWTDGPSNV